MTSPTVTRASADGAISTDLSIRRTAMSFQRTRMSADRTLMSVQRTSLSLISFGFTIFQLFRKAAEQGLISSAAPAQNFGTALVALGIGMLLVGILYHVQYMLSLRKELADLKEVELIHNGTNFPISLTLVIASLLLLIGIGAIASMIFHIGPF